MHRIEETFLPGHTPSVRMRDRTIDVDSMELEVVDARPRTRGWIGGGTLLAASVILVVGIAALFVLDETRFRMSTALREPASPRAHIPPLPSLAAPEAVSEEVVDQPAEKISAEPITPAAQEAKPAAVGEVAEERAKPLRKRSQTKRTRAVISSSSRTVTKRTHRR